MVHSHNVGSDPSGARAPMPMSLGVIASGQTKRRCGRGRGFAVAGTVASILSLGLATTGCGAITGGPSAPTGSAQGGASAGTKTEPSNEDVSKIRPGQCFNDTVNGNLSTTAPGQEVEELAVVSCDTPHDAQALAVFELNRGVWPGEQQVDTAAETGCERRIGKRISRDPAADKLVLSWYAPTQEGWRWDRGVLCAVVHATDGKKLTRPLR